MPFADHNAMLDPSCPDITARVLEALGHFGYGVDHPAVAAPSTSCAARRSPTAAGSAAGASIISTAPGRCSGPAERSASHGPTRWCGGRSHWLEVGPAAGRRLGRDAAPATTTRAGRASATPTASQTAWALLGLIAAGEADSHEVAAGIDWLVERRTDDGTGTRSRSPAPASRRCST